MAIKNNNELFWKLFKIAGGGTDSDVTKVLDSIVKSDKAKLDQYFTNAVDQIAFDTEDWQRLREFFIDLFSSERALMTQSRQISDPHYLSNQDLDELFRSFGYPESVRLSNYDNNPLENKVQLFLDLVNLYKIKGTPRSIFEILQYYGIPNLDIFEFWLQKEDPSTLIFKGDVIIGTTTNPGSIKLPYELLTTSDPHWMLTHDQILQLDQLNKINLPSKTPYFGVQPTVEVGIENAIFIRTVQDQYDYWSTTGNLPPQNAEITLLGVNCSLLELYLLTLYSFHKDYEIGSDISRFACYDGTNVSAVDILAEYDDLVYGSNITRDVRRINYQKYIELFSRERDRHFLYGTNTAESVLNTINPSLVPAFDLLSGGNSAHLQSLLGDLAIWVRNNIGFGFVNLGYIFFGLNQLFQELKPVINFFKPYRARLIVLELIRLNNILTEGIPVEDEMGTTDIDEYIYDYIPSRQTCTPDSTSISSICLDTTSFNSSEVYDCGSFYDGSGIGSSAIKDPCPIYIEIDQNLWDGFRCPPGCPSDTTSAIVCDTFVCDRMGGNSYQDIVNDFSGIIVPDTSYCTMLTALTDESEPYVYQAELLKRLTNVVNLNEGDLYKTIEFNTEVDLDYIVNVNVINTTDFSSSIYCTVSYKTSTSFMVEFSSPIDSDNYQLLFSINPDSTKSDSTPLTFGGTTHRIDFNSPITEVDYGISASITSTSNSSLYAFNIIEKDLLGFKIELSGPLDSGAYSLDWNIYDSTSTIEYGLESILSGSNEVIVSIPTQLDTSYNVDLTLINTVDLNAPIYSFMLVDKTTSSFTVRFSDNISLDNYKLSWSLTYSKEDIVVTCKDMPYVFSEHVYDTFDKIEDLSIGSESITIVFSEPLDDSLYVVNINLFNEYDGANSSMYGISVTEKTIYGFTVTFSSPLDSVNYKLAWNVNATSTASGIDSFIENEITHRVNFDSNLDNENYAVATAISNQIDTPSSMYNFIITNKDVSGFDILLSSPIDSTNYSLEWNVFDSTSFILNGVVNIPQGVEYLEVDIDDQDNDQYNLAISLINTIDASPSIYSYIVTQKNTNNFSIRFSSPIDSGNYKLSWAMTYRAEQTYIFRQESGFRLFDTMGRFDCTHGFDVVEITMDVVSQVGVILQENEGWLLQEASGDFGLLLE